ncbi:invasion associated locus B family protein [Methylobacterium sp. A54F]
MPSIRRVPLLASLTLAVLMAGGAASVHAQAPEDGAVAEPEAAPAKAKRPPPKKAPPQKTAAPPAQATPAASAAKAVWPEGATSLSEVYGDWTVNCARANEAANCMVMQSQGDAKAARRQFAIELSAPREGRATGLILMPFGLAIEPGVRFKLDEADLGKGAPFSSCSYEGCLVPISFPALATDTMKTAKNLIIQGQKPGGGEPLTITVPLAGFGQAFGRAIGFGG